MTKSVPRKQPSKNKSKRTRNLGDPCIESTNHPSKRNAMSKYKTDFPPLILSDGDEILGHKNSNAAFIVTKDSNSAAVGMDHCGRLEMRTGMGRAENDPVPNRALSGIEVSTRLNSKTDAAFVSVVETAASIDHELGLAYGYVGTSPGRSAIGMSADAVRICADEGIKLVTKRKRRNSKGQLNTSTRGIDIIAGNDDRGLEPMVKGQSLVYALRNMQDQISDLNGIIFGILMAQLQYNLILMNHFHFSPFFAIPTTISIGSIMGGGACVMSNMLSITDLIMHKVNSVMSELNSLYPIGKGYVCSRHNNVN